MDENSCEGETSKSIGNVVDEEDPKKAEKAPELQNVGVRFAFDGKESRHQVSDRCGSSFDASVSGPSRDFTPFKPKDDTTQLITQPTVPTVDIEVQEETPTCTSTEPVATPTEQIAIVSTEPVATPTEPIAVISTEPAASTSLTLQPTPQIEITEQIPVTHILPNYDDRRDYQPRVRLAPGVEEQLEARRPSVGPPPSYSFVMKQKKKFKPLASLDPLVTDRPPPPTYSNSRGLYGSIEENRLDRICNLPSFAEPIWRSHSQPALCPRCGIIVLTTTHSHDSVATHVAALALCLFGCWPCCLLPYCMNVCKNTYHHCPICQTFLGLYTPW